MKILITGSNGFIGRNLSIFLSERSGVEVLSFTKGDEMESLPSLVQGADIVFHLAGINRPKDVSEFAVGNVELTNVVCRAVRERFESTGKMIPVVYSSSIQAEVDNPYGQSKREGEEIVFALNRDLGIPTYVFRLPNVFGKWAKPNYNSVVATFCYNVAHGIPISVHDPASPLTLVYVDDVIQQFVEIVDGLLTQSSGTFIPVSRTYTVTVGELAGLINGFRESRSSLVINRVGEGFVRALYATYVSYLSPDSFSYKVPQYSDARGNFVEMLKTLDSGQFSFFTAHPGITRGGHYHHSKTEKFLVIRGRALFRFRHVVSGELYDLETTGGQAEIVETVPGWTHDVTNIGTDELIVMLWANEVFDRDNPDTYVCPI